MNQGDQPHGTGQEPLPEGEERAPPGTGTMSVIRWGLVGLMALAAAGAWGYHLAGRPAAGLAHQQRYVCPMHPQVVSDQKGDCPICGMDLVPAGTSATPPAAAAVAPASGGVPGLAPVELSSDRVQLMGMKTAAAERQPLATSLHAVGFVAASENGLLSISTRYSGWVENLPVAQSGQLVQKGDVLATVYSPELINAQSVFLNALKWAGGRGTGPAATTAVSDLERDPRVRLELMGMAPEDVDTIADAQLPMRAVPVRAPARGYVARKNAVKGSFVQAGAELFQLADLSTVWVLVDVYEGDLARVRLGQQATFTTTSAPGRRFTGRVQFISPGLNTGSRTLQARLELPNPGLVLRPGVFGDVTLETGATQAVVIPADAVVDTGQHRYVFVDKGSGRFEPRAIRTGESAGGRVAVLEGLAPGEQVVVKATFLLDSESRLRAAVEGHGK